MTRTKFQLSFAVSICLMALTTSPATAQLKPTIDPNIQTYVRSTAITGTLSIAGSDTMKSLTQRWEGKLREIYPDFSIQAQGLGSETGALALLDGKAQIATLSRKMTLEEIAAFTKRYGYEPTEVPVAADALAVFVHRDNPVTGLTLQELDAIFCKERRRGSDQPITNWGQLGLGDEWSQAGIRLHGRNSSSGSATFFLEHVCQNGEFLPTLKPAPGAASIVVEITKDRYAAGFSGIGFRTSKVRPIALADRKGSAFVEPNFETVINGTYPLRRHLYLYVNKPPKSVLPAIVSEFIKFAISQEGQQVVAKEGFFPLPAEELNRQLAAWTQPIQAATAGHSIPSRD
ncbi:MAG: phosphate ABC transporter substrate-binding protein [Nitrospira sp.]|nr:phosphate ABC transporter substrate-binding protein [Nitrospira sp.]